MFPLKCEYVAFSRIISDERLDVLETGQVGLELKMIDCNTSNRCPYSLLQAEKEKEDPACKTADGKVRNNIHFKTILELNC